VPPPSPSPIADTKDLVIVCQLSFNEQAGLVMNPDTGTTLRIEGKPNQTNLADFLDFYLSGPLSGCL